MKKVLDVSGRKIKVGDWCVQAFNLGRCAALKYSIISKINEETGRMRAKGFEPQSWEDDGSFRAGGEYNIMFPDRSCVIPTECVYTMIPVQVIELGDAYREAKGL